VHELAVCQALIEQVEVIVHRHQAREAKRLVLRIGPLSGVEPHLVEQAFPIASAGTVAADAELVIDSLPVMVNCTGCGATTSVLPNRLVCASCGDWHTTLVSGDELELFRIELEGSTTSDQSSDTAPEQASSGNTNRN
jgi:hydrogenase nickel incorporation protein HypA/HybF